MLDAVERTTGPDPTWSIVWLHGLGDSGHGFAPIVPELVRPGWPALRFVFPHAPERAVTINGGARMRAWYDIRDFDSAGRADEAGVRESIAQVDELLAREGERGLAPSRVILAGFSQGGAIALETMLRREAALAGVVALSTYLPIHRHAASETTSAGRSTPVFLGHGAADPVVKFDWGVAAREALKGLGVPVEWHAYQGMPHTVYPAEVRDVGDWLTARFAAG